MTAAVLLAFPCGLFCSVCCEVFLPLLLSCFTEYNDDEGMEITTSDDVEVLNTFDGMGLREDLLRGIYAYGELIGCSFGNSELFLLQVLRSLLRSSNVPLSLLFREET